MTTLETAIVVFKALVLALGGLVTFFAYQAFKRTRSPALRALAMGFGVVTLGSALAGILHLFVHVDILTSVLVQSALTAVGFAVIVYSLYAE